jgi:dephospho-CoA kinase
MQRRISDIYKKDKNSFIIIDAPLLIESGFHKSCDAVVVVKSNLRLQVKRCRQKNIIPQEAMRRIKKQMPIAKKIGFADYVINNTGSLSELKKSCRESANIIRKKYI